MHFSTPQKIWFDSFEKTSGIRFCICAIAVVNSRSKTAQNQNRNLLLHLLISQAESVCIHSQNASWNGWWRHCDYYVPSETYQISYDIHRSSQEMSQNSWITCRSFKSWLITMFSDSFHPRFFNLPPPIASEDLIIQHQDFTSINDNHIVPNVFASRTSRAFAQIPNSRDDISWSANFLFMEMCLPTATSRLLGGLQMS